MQDDVVIRLKSLGVDVPICCNCSSENFESFTTMAGKVINCDQCNFNLKKDEPRNEASTSEDGSKGVLLPNLQKRTVLAI